MPRFNDLTDREKIEKLIAENQKLRKEIDFLRAKYGRKKEGEQQ